MSWPLVRVRDIAVAHYGKALKKEHREEAGSYDVFGSSGKVGYHTARLIDKPTLVVGRKGSVGEITWAPNGGWIIDTAYFLELPNPKVIDLRYLFYALKRANLAQRTITTSIPGLNRDDFYDAEIPLPPLAEQERIATILDKAEAIRRKRQQAIQLADEFLRSVFLDMFGEYVTADGYAEADKAKIRDLVDYIDYRGKTPTKSESGIPLITAKNVKKGFVDVEPREYIPAENYEAWMTRGLPQENDVLFTTEAPLGNVALLGKYEKVVVGQRLIALRSKGRVTHEFLMHLLLDPFVQGLIMNRSSGSTVKGIRTKELYEIELPIPDIDRQVEFSNIYWKIKSLTQNEFISSGWNEDVFNSLSQRAFSGLL